MKNKNANLGIQSNPTGKVWTFCTAIDLGMDHSNRSMEIYCYFACSNISLSLKRLDRFYGTRPFDRQIPDLGRVLGHSQVAHRENFSSGNPVQNMKLIKYDFVGLRLITLKRFASLLFHKEVSWNFQIKAKIFSKIPSAIKVLYKQNAL